MRIPLATALACFGLALTACGSDDETTSTTSAPQTGASGVTGEAEDAVPAPRDKTDGPVAGASDDLEVADAVTAVVGGGDPEAACTSYATEDYVKSAYGDEQGCRAAVGEQGPVGVAIGDISVDPDAGTAETTAVPDGGPNKGETLTVRLVDEGGAWKVDFVRSDAPAGP
jgi:hypothetical protein